MRRLKVKEEGIILNKTEPGFESEGYCRLSNPLTVEQRLELPLLYPRLEYEKQGLEDPRIVKIDDICYLSYTAYDGVNALGVLATSSN